MFLFAYLFGGAYSMKQERANDSTVVTPISDNPSHFPNISCIRFRRSPKCCNFPTSIGGDSNAQLERKCV